MEHKLRQIMYLSEASPFFSSELSEDMARVASVKNQKQGITGCLVRSGDLFLQFIEGPSDAISKLFEVIEGDIRHHDITLVHDALADTRCFPDWGMQQITTNSIVRPKTIQDLIAKDPNQAINWIKSL